MGQVHENIVNDEKLNSFGRLFSPFYQNMRQKLEWNVEFILPESPTTNVMFIVEGKEGVGKLGEFISTKVSILNAVDPDIFCNQSSLPLNTHTHMHTHMHTHS